MAFGSGEAAGTMLDIKPHHLQTSLFYAEKHLWADRGWSKGGAAAAKAGYVPMLKEYAAEVKAKGGPTFRAAPPCLPEIVLARFMLVRPDHIGEKNEIASGPSFSRASP